MVKKNQLSKWMLGSAVAGLVVSGGIFQHNVLSVGYSVAHAEEQPPAKDEKAKDEKTAKTKDASCGQGNCGANMKDEKAKTN